MPSVDQQIDTYQDTVWALLGLHHELIWDDEKGEPLPAASYAARHTERVKLTDGSFVTPDIHIKVPDGLPVGDIKMSFAGDGDRKRLQKVEGQLRRYDIALGELAKSTKTPKNECALVLLVHTSRVKSAARFVAGLDPFDHKIGVVGYHRTDQVQSFITLDLRHGEIVPAAKHQKLDSDPLQIDVNHLTRDYADVLFYDADAPDLYVAEIFWTTILPDRAAAKAGRDGRPAREVQVNAANVAKELAKGYSIRRICKNAKQSPSTTQMRRVFKMLERMELAKLIGADNYFVKWVDFRDDIRTAFEKRLKKADEREAKQRAKARKGDRKTMEMFPNS